MNTAPPVANQIKQEIYFLSENENSAVSIPKLFEILIRHEVLFADKEHFYMIESRFECKVKMKLKN